MGVILHTGANIMPFIGALYGWPTVIGLVFTLIVYAAAVGLVTGGILLPITMNVLGRQSFPEPLLPLPGVLGGLLVILPQETDTG